MTAPHAALKQDVSAATPLRGVLSLLLSLDKQRK